MCNLNPQVMRPLEIIRFSLVVLTMLAQAHGATFNLQTPETDGSGP